MKRVLAIYRAKEFSPNSVAKDEAIMAAVIERLRNRGCVVVAVSEEVCPLMGIQPYFLDVVLSMGRREETLRWLASLDVTIINSPHGVARCRRSVLERLMRENGVPVPPPRGTDGYWLKRGDGSARMSNDVVFAADQEQLERKMDDFRRRGIDYTVSAHVVGDVVKFYGVRGSGFFCHYYPTDDGDTKFGDELHNGPARHYPFSVADLQQTMERFAGIVGVDVYGGDCIVRQDGTFCVIDFNDWPSFSRCCDEAAEAVVALVARVSEE